MSVEALTDAIQLIDKAQAMTRDMRSQITRAHLLDFADQQLQFMREVLKQGRTPTDDEKSKIVVGRMAIQEFEGGSFDDYATALEEAAGAFRLL